MKTEASYTINITFSLENWGVGYNLNISRGGRLGLNSVCGIKLGDQAHKIKRYPTGSDLDRDFTQPSAS